MSDDRRAVSVDDGEGAVPPLPVLMPVPVIREEEVDAMVRTARADVALLALHLRAARAEADEADREARADLDLAGAREVLRASLDRHVAQRRHEQAEERHEAGREAIRAIQGAQAEAAAIVAEAHDAAAHLLLPADAPDPDDGPVASTVLRVVPDVGAGTPPGPAVAPGLPAAPTGEPVGPGGSPAIAGPAPAPGPASPPSPGGPVAGPPSGSAPGPVPAAPVLAAATGMLPAATGGLPTEDDALWACLGEGEPHFDDGWLSGRRGPAGAVAAPAPVAPGARPPRSGWARFLYADVVLPMVAVLVVFVVLLAWVG